MFKKIISLLVISIVCLLKVQAQYLTPEQYIEMYKDYAIKEMKRMGVPAAITLAQGLLETENGNSTLVKKSNNHFGIKCKSNWTAESVTHDDDAPGECFRSYKDAEDSYRDHSNFLRGNDRYAFLFQLNPTDYKGWARGLKKAGYATNPKYPNILIKSIEQYNLQQYDLAAADEVPVFDSKKFQDDPVVFDANQKIEGNYDNDQKIQPQIKLTNENSTPALEFNTPGKVTAINGSKCIWATAGTSLLAIATQHKVNLSKLLDYNDLEEDGILEVDQLVFLQRKSTKGEKPFYVVTKRESYYDISQRNGIQFQNILEYNQVNDDKDLQPGTKVYLQPVAESDQASVVANNAGKVQLYAVQPKEGLYAVAKKHSVTVQQLREWNNLTSDDLKIGQQLIVGK
ncbi:glucosaminidase domain-containing protein [soil metagenome]